MTMEEATEKAKKMLAKDFVSGVSCAGDTYGEPTAERIEELAKLIADGVIDSAILAEVQ